MQICPEAKKPCFISTLPEIQWSIQSSFNLCEARNLTPEIVIREKMDKVSRYLWINAWIK